LASYKKGINKRVPHFKMLKNVEHEEFCPIKKSVLFVKAKNQSICDEDGFPFSYPSKLSLENATTGTNILRNQKNVLQIKGHYSQGVSKKQHNHTVKTIRPLAIQFLEFPFDRHLKLSVPFVEGNYYNEIFQYLSSKKLIHPSPKIFFGSLNFKKTNVFENYFEIILSQGKWTNSKPEEYIRIIVNTQNWSQLEKQATLDEIDVARSEYKENLDYEKQANISVEKKNQKKP
jgi:hypothetical protein